MSLNPVHLRTLHQIARLQSFSRAAEALHLSQPAVSLHVRQLEQALGMPLLERVGKRAGTTRAGMLLLQRAGRALEALDAAAASIHALRGVVAGRVRLGTGATASIYLLPPILRRLRTRYPEVELVIVTGNTSDIAKAVTENTLAVGVVTLPVRPRQLVVTPFYTDRLVAIAQLDRGRALVVRHAAPAVLDEILLGRRRAGAQDHQGLDGLAPFLVGHTDYRGFGHPGVLVEAVLHLDRRHVLPARDDHVLLAVGDGDEGSLGEAAIARVEPAVHDGLGRLLRLIPVPLEHVVGAGEHFTLGVHAHAHAHRGYPRAGQPARPFRRIQSVPVPGGAVDGQEGRSLGETVDLDELPAQLRLDALDGLRRRWRARDDHSHSPAPRHLDPLGPARRRRVEHGSDDGGRGIEERHSFRGDPAQDLLAVDLADDDLACPDARDRIRHAPAIAVEGRQGMEVDVAVGHAEMPPERHGIEPEVAVGELHPLGPRGGARRVVDGDGGILVRHLHTGLRALAEEELLVGGGSENEAMLHRDLAQRLVELGIHEQDGRAGVLDDVADLLRVQAEVDGHEGAPEHAHAEEAHEEARGIGRHDGHAIVLAHPQIVEARRETPGHLRELTVAEAPEAAPGRIGLVDHRLAVAVDQLGAVEEVTQGERYDHGRAPSVR